VIDLLFTEYFINATSYSTVELRVI